LAKLHLLPCFTHPKKKRGKESKHTYTYKAVLKRMESRNARLKKKSFSAFQRVFAFHLLLAWRTALMESLV